MGPQGTFTFITYSPHKSRVFIDELKTAILKATPEGERYEVRVWSFVHCLLRNFVCINRGQSYDMWSILPYILTQCERGVAFRIRTRC